MTTTCEQPELWQSHRHCKQDKDGEMHDGQGLVRLACADRDRKVGPKLVVGCQARSGGAALSAIGA